MIAKGAIEKFLERKLNNYDWIKKCSDQELNEALDEMQPRPNFHTPLRTYQKAAFLILEELGRFLLFLPMGTGKTLVTLSLIQYRKKCGDNPKAIVFIPFNTGHDTWIEETTRHAPDLKCISLLKSTKENLHDLCNEDGDLFVITYQGAVAMLSDTVASRKRTEGSKKKKMWVLNRNYVQDLFYNNGFNMLVADESHRIKSHTSLYYRMCLLISEVADDAFALTGTPLGTDPMDLWAQFRAVDLGETLGETLGIFRETFFTQKDGYWGGVKYKFKAKMTKELHTRIKNRSLNYDEKDCVDLPPKTEIEKKLRFPKATKAYYDKAFEELKERVQARSSSKRQEYRAIDSSFVLLRQTASGFMTFKSEDSEKIKIRFKDNPKIDALLSLIDGIPSTSKMVVFHDFVYSNHLISEALTKAKIGHARVWGGQRNSLEEIRRFKSDPKCRILVINTKSGSSTLNLQIANYVVFYELPTSVIDFQQAIKRVWRGGQTRRVFFYYLLIKGSIEIKGLYDLRRGIDMFKRIIQGKEKL